MVDPTDQIWAFTVEAVRNAIDNLTANPIHEHFSGYLAVLRAIRAHPAQPAKMSDILEFHTRYLRAEGAPPRSPYVRPFKSRGRGLEFVNINVSGSYAPSSIREAGKFVDVVDVEGTGQDANYILIEDHAHAALNSLLSNKKVRAASLAAFLYRDYGFVLEEPSILRVLNIFRDEFGLRASEPAEQEIYETLFEDDTFRFSSSSLQRIEPTHG